MSDKTCYSVEVQAPDGTVYRGAHWGKNPDEVCCELSEWMPDCRILKIKG